MVGWLWFVVDCCGWLWLVGGENLSKEVLVFFLGREFLLGDLLGIAMV